MNTKKDTSTRQETTPTAATRAKYPIHPYFTSNSAEETIRRMRGVRERIAKFEEQLNANRKSDQG